MFLTQRTQRPQRCLSYYASAEEAQLTRAEDTEVKAPLNLPIEGRANERWADSFPISDFTFPFAYLCALLS